VYLEFHITNRCVTNVTWSPG